MRYTKKDSRLRRTKKLRAFAKKTGVVRLCVHKTSQHIYAQILSADGANTLASASSLKMPSGGNVAAAKQVGEDIAKKAQQLKLEKVMFDRAGFQYHGRIKALAESARENGLNF